MIALRRCRWPVALVATFVAACTPDDFGGECATHDDCPAATSCLYDEPRGTTYCTASCQRDLDCPDTRACVGVAESPAGGASGSEDRICLELVRACGTEEPCNGLDDDCDGTVDEDCTPVECRTDLVCGAFTCQAPPEADAPVCTARAEGAPRAYYGECTSGADCPNGTCDAGLCTPFCQIDRSDSPFIEVPDCRNDVLADLDGDGADEAFATVCAEQISPGGRPPHNACQVLCDRGPEVCPDDLACVWRRIFPFEDEHWPVCSVLDPELSPLGASCPNNEIEGDNSCQHGLCLFQTCTRLCGGVGDDCADVGPDFECQNRRLVYRDPSIGGPQRFFDVLACVPAGS